MPLESKFGIKMKYKITILLLITNILQAQTCKLELEVPSTTPDSRFTDNGNGTITDNGTGLMWQKCQLGLSGSSCTNGSATTHNWQQALDQADSNILAGYSDWRLPNHKELYSIVEHRCYNPSINTIYFPNTYSNDFWSNSPVAIGSDYTWIVNFNYGYYNGNGRYDSQYVRLVRFGQ